MIIEYLFFYINVGVGVDKYRYREMEDGQMINIQMGVLLGELIIKIIKVKELYEGYL